MTREDAIGVMVRARTAKAAATATLDRALEAADDIDNRDVIVAIEKAIGRLADVIIICEHVAQLRLAR